MALGEIRECCQEHYGLVVGSRYTCLERKNKPGQNLMFKPNPDNPMMTMVVDCECPCHEGEGQMATKKTAPKKDVKKTPAKGKGKTPAKTGTAKTTAKTPAKGKAKAEPKTNEKREKYLAGKIKVLVKENPKRAGSASHDRFELYTKNKTIQEYFDAGGSQKDLNWDMDKGFIEFKTLKSY